MPRKKRGVFKRTQRKKVLIALYWWEDRVFEGVAQAAAEYGWILDCRMRWMHTVPSQWDGDGIIANPGFSRPLQPLLELIDRSGAPTIELQSFHDYPCEGRVVIDQEGVGRIAAQYLLSLGFRHLGYVPFMDNPLERVRSKSFRAAVEKAGATFYSLPYGRLAESLQECPKPLGLWALNDVNAIDVMTACLDSGFRVPEEIAVLGSDDSRTFCDFAEVPLSSVRCNFEEQGRLAADMLQKVMHGEPLEKESKFIQPSGVTTRRSTDTIAVPDIGAARALRILRDRFRQQLKMPDIAREVGVSLRHLQDSFRKHLGFTLVHELTRVRVEHAKALLESEELKLDAVAFECGFSNRFHFIRAFERITGETPTGYRKRMGAETNPGSD